MGKRKQVEMIQGTANHKRTEGVHMGLLLDAVMHWATFERLQATHDALENPSLAGVLSKLGRCVNC